MFKKLFIGALLLGMLSVFTFGRETWSYFRTSVTHVRQAIKSEVPVEFELERARKMVEEILPDIRQCMHVIAEEEVNVEELNREIDRRTADLKGMKTSLLAQRDAVDSPEVVTVSAVSHVGAKRELAAKFARFKTLEETLGSKQQILDARGGFDAHQAIDLGKDRPANGVGAEDQASDGDHDHQQRPQGKNGVVGQRSAHAGRIVVEPGRHRRLEHAPPLRHRPSRCLLQRGLGPGAGVMGGVVG